MPNTEDIKIFFEEGELINKYLESQKKGIQQAQPVLFIVDSEDETAEEDIYQKGYVACDSCKQEIMNYCPKCGNLDIDTRRLGLWCSHCTFKFIPEEILREHKTRCQVQQPLEMKRNFVRCPFCKRRKNSRLLYSHLKVCGLKNGGSTPPTTAPISIKYKDQYLCDYTCRACKMGFGDIAAYTSHLIDFHKFKSKTLKCPFCLEIHTTDESLLAHMRESHSMQRYLRPILPKAANSTSISSSSAPIVID